MRSLLSSYTNLVEIGRGGMATVYRATSAATGHLVAIKVLDMHLVNDPTARARFAQEASFQLAHPNIIRVIEHDVDARGSTPYIVMEYVAGESLEQRLQREGKQAPKAIMPILKDIGNGLDYAHSQGVIHRDVKPNNILIRAKNGQALLADFGIAKTASFTAYTATMARVGSVLFMSPEQAAGEPMLSPSSDIYSLGVTAYYALSGRHPFEGEDQVAIARKHIDQVPAHPSDVDPNVPRAVGDVVMRALHKQPMQRPGSAGDFVQQLEKAVTAPAQSAVNPANGVLQGAGVLPRSSVPTGSGVLPQAPVQPNNNPVRDSGRTETLRKPGISWRVVLGALGIVILGLLCGLLALLWPVNTQGNGAQGNGTATSQAAATGTSPASAGTAEATNPAGTPGTVAPGAGATAISSNPTVVATTTVLTLTPNVIVPQTATAPPLVVIVPSVDVAPTLPPYVPEPTSTRVPQFPVVIPTATQPLLYPPTTAPPTRTPPPPSMTPTAPTPLPTFTPTATSTPSATPTLPPTVAPTPSETLPAATPEPTATPTVTIVP